MYLFYDNRTAWINLHCNNGAICRVILSGQTRAQHLCMPDFRNLSHISVSFVFIYIHMYVALVAKTAKEWYFYFELWRPQLVQRLLLLTRNEHRIMKVKHSTNYFKSLCLCIYLPTIPTYYTNNIKSVIKVLILYNWLLPT